MSLISDEGPFQKGENFDKAGEDGGGFNSDMHLSLTVPQIMTS